MQTMKNAVSQVVIQVVSSVKPSSSPAVSAAIEWVNPFERFDFMAHPRATEAHRAVKEWTYAISRGEVRGLLLWSREFGCGKTHLARLAYEFLREVASEDGQRQRVTFLTAPDFFQEVKDLYSQNAPVAPLFDNWLKGHFILDDWGKQYTTTSGELWAREQFFRLIDGLNERRGLLMTSNERPEQIERQIGGASWSRLLGMCGLHGIIDMSAVPDYRLKKAGF